MECMIIVVCTNIILFSNLQAKLLAFFSACYLFKPTSKLSGVGVEPLQNSLLLRPEPIQQLDLFRMKKTVCYGVYLDL